jgi:GxxExxY protein
MATMEDTMYRKEQTLFSPEHEAIITNTIACGIAVHRELGPGFKERIYERAFCLELESRGIKFECEKPVEVRYKNWRIPGQKIDLMVEGLVLVEIKAVSRLKGLHRSQVISYLKTTELRVGLLMNFNSSLLKDGLRRIVL